jgi:beta-galactosidase
VVFTVLAMFSPTEAQSRSANTILIDASKPADARVIPNPRLGGKSPAGHEIGVNSQYLTLDGRPWLPVMGEFHFSRYPEQYWEKELLKMKAGGVQIVATYLFWIHHEEIERQFDWSGQRDLRRFLQLCDKHGLYVFLRIGPWSHGEVRNGGFPDWLLTKGVTRRNDPQYLSYVQRYFGQIGEQVKGLLWKDGGPIIGVQFENEYYEHGPGASAEHISELKKIARESGIEAPLYTVTGWGNPDFPAGQVIPVFGGYPDNFWESTLTDLPPSGYYLFENTRDNGEMGPSAQEQTARPDYPYLMAEAGGGMQVAYHRRPVIGADDVAAITLTRLGSGANLYGYYMFQGGSNPEGKLTSLQESVASDHVYDLPKVSYDFQAPLGEFGQMNPSFRATKMLHLFLHEFGSSLATMTPVLPNVVPTDAGDGSTVRVSARTEGNRGFVFFNNYARNYPLPDHPEIQIKLILPSETVVLPRKPIDLAAGTYGIWPVNLDLNEILLKYATAQPLTRVRDGNVEYYFFVAPPGMRPEFAFDESTLASLKAAQAAVISRAAGVRYVDGIAPGPGIALSTRSKTGQTVHIVVLTPSEALDLWKCTVAGREHVFLSAADVFFDETSLHLRARDVRQLRFSVFPALKNVPLANVPLHRTGRDGVFVSYSAATPTKHVPVRWEKICAAAPSLPGKMGKYNAMAPTDSDFDRAGAWRIVIPEHALDGLNDAFLRIQYAGDVARLYDGQRLLGDDFYKGTIWEIGLKRFAPEALGKNLELKVMPLRKDAKIYLPHNAWPQFPPSGEIADVPGIRVVPEYEVRVDLEGLR